MKNPVVWFEVVGMDGDKLRRFYSDLFGWKIDGATGDMDYGLVAAGNGDGGTSRGPLLSIEFSTDPSGRYQVTLRISGYFSTKRSTSSTAPSWSLR